MNARKLTFVASFAAAALALSACSAGNAESPTPSPSVSATASSAKDSTSASPTPSKKNEYKPASAAGPAENVPVPKMPKEAKKNTEEGAAAFTEYYFELINYTGESTMTKSIKDVTSRSCKECAVSIIDPAEESSSIGEWQVGGKYEMSIIDSHIPTSGKAIVTTSFASEPFKTYIEPNSVVAEYSEVKSTLATFQLSFDSTWKVENLLLDGE